VVIASLVLISNAEAFTKINKRVSVAHGWYTAGNKPGAEIIDVEHPGSDPFYFDTKLALTPQGQPCLVWDYFEGGHPDGQREVMFGCWNGSAWVGKKNNMGPDNVSNTTLQSASPQIAINDIGSVFISWVEYDAAENIPNGDIKLAVWDGSDWSGFLGNVPDTVNQNEKSAIYAPTLAVDPVSGNPALSWTNHAQSTIYFRKWTGLYWKGMTDASEDIVQNQTWVSTPKLIFTSTGAPQLVWLNTRFDPRINFWVNDIQFKKWDRNKWRGNLSNGADVLNNPGVSVTYPTIAMGPANEAFVAWDNGYKTQFRYWTGTDWSGYTGTVDTISGPHGAMEPSIAVGQSGTVFISFLTYNVNETQYYAYITKWNGSKWGGMTTDKPERINTGSTQFNAYSPDLKVVGRFEKPFVTWTKDIIWDGDVVFTHWL